jgi:hypothetical protein
MDEAKKKQLGQIGILIALIVVGVIVTIVMRPKPPATGGATASAASKPATEMDKAGITPDMQRSAGSTSVPAAGGAGVQKLNPNMWKVYAITPPKNPFVQQESWYADTFKRLLPGYPELKNSGFFDKPTEVMPDVNRIFGKDLKFKYIDLNRDFKEINHTLTGLSADGKMSTTLTASEDAPDGVHLTFDQSGNVIDKNTIQGQKRGGSVGGDDVPLGEFDGQLPLPDGLMTQGAQGTGMAVHGVSINSGRASALVMLNGSSRIVAVGDALTAKFAVSKITGSGIEVKDTETGEKKFIEIKAPDAGDKEAPAAMLRGLNL